MHTLILDYNHFESNHMTSFKEFIRQSRIHTLSINYCKLGDNGGVAIGEALYHANGVREVRAKNNDFRDKTAKSIAEALEHDSVIERLDLSNNLINDAGGELLGLAMGLNKNLSFFNLRKNNLRATSGKQFAASMKENKTLKCLKLEKNSINCNFIEEIEKYIERNVHSLLENNISELKQNREGFLATRLDAWKEVKDKTEYYSSKTVRLETTVRNLTQKKARLDHELDDELQELNEALSY